MSTTLTTILNHLDGVAVISGGLFAGIAFYFTIGEMPALREFGLNEQWRFFPYIYKRTGKVQASLALIAGISGITYGTRIVGAPFYRNLWLAAGTTFFAIVPYTMGFLLSINKQIIDDGELVQSGGESSVTVATKKELLDKWVVLHSIRTVASLAGFVTMVFGITRHSSFIYSW